MATETAQQKKLLDQIEHQAALLAAQETASQKTRTKLISLMVKAKDARASSYKIALAANLSQPRVMQIIKTATKESVPAAPKLPSQKKLLDQVASLQKQLDEANEKLQAQEVME